MASEPTLSDLTLPEVFRHTLDGIFVLDRDRQYVMFSPGCERITGYSANDVLGAQCRCHTLTDCHDRQGRSLAAALCPGLHILQGKTHAGRQRMRIRHRDGHHVWVETTYAPLSDDDGGVACVVGIMRNVSDAVEYEATLEKELAAARNSTRTEEDMDATTTDGTDTHSRAGALDSILERVERDEIIAALHRTGGQRTKAARILGISRSRLYRRMEALGIDPRASSM